MKIWIIAEGEGLPFGKDRLMRAGMLARDLASYGHEVTWWTSTFLHGKKKYLFDEYKVSAVQPNETLILLHARHGYHKNMSLKRLDYVRLLGKEFRKHCEEIEKPDIIRCSWPTMSFAREAVRYGERHGIPVIIDICDLWPDTFVRAFPKFLRGIAPLAIRPAQWRAANTLKRATHIMSMSMDALNWGCAYAGRKPGPLDRYIPICNDPIQLSEQEREKYLRWWAELGATEKTWNICFFSSLSAQGIDLDTVIRAVKQLAEKYPDIRLLIGGKGDAEEYLRSVAGDCPNIIFAGWLDQGQMNSAMTISKCGIYCLRNMIDFVNTFSNKAIQYLSGSLPVITCLTGFASSYLREYQMGYTYEEGNAASCAEMIEKLYLDEPSRQKMGENALAQYSVRFDSRIVNRQFEEYFYEVINEYKG